MPLGTPGRILIRPGKTAGLYDCFGERRKKQGILTAGKAAAFGKKFIPVDVKGNGLSDFFSGSSSVCDTQPAQGNVIPGNPERGRAECTAGLSVRQDFSGTVIPEDFRFICARPFNDGIGAKKLNLFAPGSRTQENPGGNGRIRGKGGDCFGDGIRFTAGGYTDGNEI